MNPTSSPAEELLVRVFREERPRLWGFFLRGAGSPPAAEDLLQETFLRTWDHRESLAGQLAEGPDPVRAYLWRVARNQMIDEIRVRVRRRAQGVTDGGVPPEEIADRPASGPAGRVEHEDNLRVVRDTVASLPNRRARRCLQLWLEGLNLSGIATEVGLQIGQVRGLLQRGRAEVILRAADRLRAPAAEGRGER